jgi:prepilin-type processing-associated H-X9-DG protein
VRSGPGKTAKNKPKKKRKKKYSGQQPKEIDCDEPHPAPNEKSNPSSGQNGQLVHWWLLIHSGRLNVLMDDGHLSNIIKLEKKNLVLLL